MRSICQRADTSPTAYYAFSSARSTREIR